MMAIFMNGATIGNFFQSLFESGAAWASWIAGGIGIIMVVAGIWQIAKGLMGGGHGQTNWAVAIICLLLGGTLAAGGGWGVVGQFTETGGTTINQLAQGQNDGTQKRDGAGAFDVILPVLIELN